MTLSEERVEMITSVVPVERVQLYLDTVTMNERIQANVAREEVTTEQALPGPRPGAPCPGWSVHNLPATLRRTRQAQPAVLPPPRRVGTAARPAADRGLALPAASHHPSRSSPTEPTPSPGGAYSAGSSAQGELVGETVFSGRPAAAGLWRSRPNGTTTTRVGRNRRPAGDAARSGLSVDRSRGVVPG